MLISCQTANIPAANIQARKCTNTDRIAVAIKYWGIKYSYTVPPEIEPLDLPDFPVLPDKQLSAIGFAIIGAVYVDSDGSREAIMRVINAFSLA